MCTTRTARFYFTQPFVLLIYSSLNDQLISVFGIKSQNSQHSSVLSYKTDSWTKAKHGNIDFYPLLNLINPVPLCVSQPPPPPPPTPLSPICLQPPWLQVPFILSPPSVQTMRLFHSVDGGRGVGASARGCACQHWVIECLGGMLRCLGYWATRKTARPRGISRALESRMDGAGGQNARQTGGLF